MELVRWNPFHELRRLADDVNRLWTSPFYTGAGWSTPAMWPSVDVHETDQEVVVSAELPGVEPQDVDVTIHPDHLVIKGETRRQREMDERGYRMQERRYGSFYRSVPFPAEVDPDRATARYRHGVLEVHAPKITPTGRGRRLAIQGEPPLH